MSLAARTLAMNPELPNHYREILLGVGENPEREGLLDTPKRAAKAMQYLCNGYHKSLEEVVNGALFESDNDEMVIVRDIELYSLCEHHILPFIEAQHMCMMMRGVEKQNSVMTSSVMLGAFRESCNTRHEFLQLIGRSK